VQSINGYGINDTVNLLFECDPQGVLETEYKFIQDPLNNSVIDKDTIIEKLFCKLYLVLWLRRNKRGYST